MSEQEHYGEYLFDDPWITGLVKRICEERDTVTTERDDYRSKFRGMEREAELLRSQLIAMQLRAENAESALRSANVKIVRLEERVGIYSSQARE